MGELKRLSVGGLGEPLQYRNNIFVGVVNRHGFITG